MDGAETLLEGIIAMIDEAERKLQEASDRVVEQGVIYCASMLISELQERLPDHEQWEDFYPPTTYNIEYKCSACNHEWIEEDLDTDDETCNCPKCDYEADAGDSDECYKEVFEHWIVDSWLARHLREKGEHVVDDFMGINHIWCRTTTGQAISMDYVIRQIAKEYYLDERE